MPRLDVLFSSVIWYSVSLRVIYAVINSSKQSRSILVIPAVICPHPTKKKNKQK